MISEIFVKVSAVILLVSVAVVLILGIGTLFKGGDTSKKYSNKLMQLRVLLQFVAIIVRTIMATNCNRTLSCISLLEYFLLVSPPLNRVPIPNINTTATETKSITALTLTNISEIINYMYYIFKEKKLKFFIK